VVPDRLSGARPSVIVWVRGSKGRKPWKGLAPSRRSQLVGARAPMPYGLGATVSDILMVNPASVIDVFSLHTHSTSRLVIKPLSG